ncbi:MAG: VTT domain-containing protein [Parvibaculum sp.]|uniref:VTT domain-containing protein n=1 Tax=Parvibaculum sp. TaxID=2024848 RepID=UPI0025DEBCA2|nr:VTT domain-containing protein [Parvibaculum sp.]MCE9648509.1 VTT domain-containing protein [Parvibaculum sp.]
MAAAPKASPRATYERAAETIFNPARNVWRVERAPRAKVLIDAAAYFSALRAAMREARHSIVIVGWDIDSRTELVGETGKADDGLPTALGPFLTALAERNPDISIKLLIWNYALFYSTERELMPSLSLGWNTPPQVELCFDGTLPLASSHHQKIVVVDDALAFSGGLDLTIRRWDTSAHRPENAQRADPAGTPYPPFHDVQMMVDGPAAGALGDLVKARWARYANETLPSCKAREDPWPETVEPDFRDVAIGISRTQAAYAGEPIVAEIEALFEDMFDAAERTLYLENQFLTCCNFAERLAQRLKEKPALELVIVAPRTHHTWFEHKTMLAGRVRFMQILREAGVDDRVRLLYPSVEENGTAADVMVHAKVTIVDDRLLRIGSANLCNRSMGTDTECDLTVEAATEAERQSVAAIRNRLVGEHCGAAESEVGAALERRGTLIAAIESLGGQPAKLRPIDDGDLSEKEIMPQIEALADPARPIAAALPALAESPSEARDLSRFVKLGIVVLAVVLLVLAWRVTPLAAYTDVDTLKTAFTSAENSVWGPLVVIGIFVVAGLFAFPVTLLIAATAAAFGGWQGLVYASCGALTSALVTYYIGRHFGADRLRGLMGPRINRLSQKIASQGILAVAMLRLVPVAPFTLVNLVAGAARVGFIDYTVGTMMGLAPGIVLMSALGRQMMEILKAPTAGDIVMLLGLLVAWAALSFVMQRLVARFRGGNAG